MGVGADSENEVGIIAGVLALNVAFSDFVIVIDDVIATEDAVVIRWTASGTQTGT